MNKHEVLGSEDVSFVMIRSNASLVSRDLDELRKNPKKFICLNDDLDHHEVRETEAVKRLLHDFYESFLPLPSSFELQDGKENSFSHLHPQHDNNCNTSSTSLKKINNEMKEEQDEENRHISLKQTEKEEGETRRRWLLLLAVSVTTTLMFLVLLALLKVRLNLAYKSGALSHNLLQQMTFVFLGENIRPLSSLGLQNIFCQLRRIN